jgi:hypothetical protein
VLKHYVVIGAFVAANLVGCLPSHPIRSMNSSTTVHDKPLDSAAVDQQVNDAMRLFVDGNWPQALPALQHIVDDGSFMRLPSDIRYRVLKAASEAAQYHGGSPEVAHKNLMRLVSMPQANFEDWQHRAQAAGRLNDIVDCVSSLTVMVSRWPERFAWSKSAISLNDGIRYIIDAASKKRVSVFPLLLALYDAHWRFHWDVEPSDAWRDLTLLLLENGHLARALDVAQHVTSAYTLIAMRADRRFDAVVAADPGHFDVETAAKRELQRFQDAADGDPESLEAKVDVIQSMINMQSYGAALAASDSIFLDIKSTNYPEHRYKDFGDYIASFMEARAASLERVERWEEARTELSAAAKTAGIYGTTGAILNLASLDCALERPNDALLAINRLLPGATDALGKMYVEVDRLDASLQLGDSRQASRSLEYLRLHRADSPWEFLLALILMNQPDQAAHELISQLRDERERQQALLVVQYYPQSPETKRDAQIDAQLRALMIRPDVRREINKVGRIERYSLEDPLF